MPYTDQDWKDLNERLKVLKTLSSAGDGIALSVEASRELYKDMHGLMTEVRQMSEGRLIAATPAPPLTGRLATLQVSLFVLERMLVLPEHVRIRDVKLLEEVSVTFLLQSEQFPKVLNGDAPIAEHTSTQHQAKLTTELRVGNTTHHAERIG